MAWRESAAIKMEQCRSRKTDRDEPVAGWRRDRPNCTKKIYLPFFSVCSFLRSWRGKAMLCHDRLCPSNEAPLVSPSRNRRRKKARAETTFFFPFFLLLSPYYVMGGRGKGGDDKKGGGGGGGWLDGQPAVAEEEATVDG